MPAAGHLRTAEIKRGWKGRPVGERDLRAYVNDMQRLIEQEFEAQREANQGVLAQNMPVEFDVRGRLLARLPVEEGLRRLGVGERIRMEVKLRGTTVWIPATIIRASHGDLLAKLNWTGRQETRKIGPVGKLIDRRTFQTLWQDRAQSGVDIHGDVDTRERDRIADAFEQLFMTNESMRPIGVQTSLRGTPTDGLLAARWRPALKWPRFCSLNESQQQAVEAGLNYTLSTVNAPPGSGKTAVTVELAMQLYMAAPPMEGSCIMLVAPTNFVANDLLKALVRACWEEGIEPAITRLYSSSLEEHLPEAYRDYCSWWKTLDERSDDYRRAFDAFRCGDISQQDVRCFLRQSREAQIQILRKTQVLISTASSFHREILWESNVICIAMVVDEAGMLSNVMLQPLLWSLKPRRITLIGDSKQIRPFTMLDHAELKESALMRWNQMGVPNTFLNQQYRMPKELADIISIVFYADRPFETVNAENKHTPLYCFDGTCILFAQVAGQPTQELVSRSWRNDLEAEALSMLVRKLVERDILPIHTEISADGATLEELKSMLIITPYIGQRTHLGKTLAENQLRVECRSIDSSQGHQEETVGISLTTTTPFVNDKHRMAVMLSRAQRAMVIVGNLDELCQSNTPWKAILQLAWDMKVAQFVEITNNGTQLGMKEWVPRTLRPPRRTELPRRPRSEPTRICPQ